MIEVMRLAGPPAILVVEGTAKAQEHCDAYDGGAREFEFDPLIYGDATVKQELVAMHHGKCCFCESKVRHTGPGTIDHYRPKAASQQEAGAPFRRPGYYWLAYDWDNLLLVCVICNQTCKRNLFPLQNDGRRALSHLHPLHEEEPLLINPTRENPADSISFREEYAFALNGNDRGRITIELLKLNDRSDLVERRREWIRVLRVLREVLMLFPHSPTAVEVQQILGETVLDTAEYAAMSWCFLH
jgi:hypothetical protein